MWNDSIGARAGLSNRDLGGSVLAVDSSRGAARAAGRAPHPPRSWARGQGSGVRTSRRPKAGVLDEGAEAWGDAQPRPAASVVSEKVPGSESESQQPSSSEASDHRVIASHSELFAAALGNVDWLRFCLNRERKERVTDDKGFTAIHFAAQQGKLGCIQVLVEEYKFPVDLPTSHCQTPLHLVIHRDNKAEVLPCIHYLLKKGAAVNSQTCNGSTPLHLAAREGLLDCVKVLVKSGANVHAQDALCCKPIDHCKIWNHRACARFLKDAMWKQDKKEFAHEMGKLTSLKEKLALMEHRYLIKYQGEQRILRQDEFKKWLHSKQLSQCHSRGSDLKQKAVAGPRSLALSKTLGSRVSKIFHPSVEARLLNLPQPTPPPKPIYRQHTISRPKLWNFSNNPARPPTIDISYPQGIRLGVHPEPCQQHDFQSFLDVTRNSLGGAWLRTVDGHWVAPVPRLPFEVIVTALNPGLKSYRMKVPQGLRPLSILRVPQKRHVAKTWPDSISMSLRETFDEAFLAILRDQGLPNLPSSKNLL